MKTSISMYSMHHALGSGELSPCEVLEFFKENGAPYVELLDNYMGTKEEKEQIKACLDSLGLKASSYSISNNFVTDEESRKQQIAYVKEAVAYAKYFGTNIIRVFSANATDEYTYEQGLDMIIDSFRQCVKTAEEAGVIFSLENHGMFAGRAEQVKHIIDAVGSKALRATTDTGNFLLVCENPLESVKTLLDYVGFVHFKDFKKADNEGYTALDGSRYIGTVIGEGEVPLPQIVSLLRKNGYDGFLSIEYEGGNEGLRESVSKSIAYVNTLV